MEKEENKLKDFANKNFEKLQRPVMAFITFTTQEAYERSLNNMETVKNFFKIAKFNDEEKNYFQLFDEKVQLIAGPEPTNIIWENLSV